MDHLFPARMSLLSSEVHSPKVIIPGCTNHSPFVPKNFKPQLEPKKMDSKVEELTTNPNQENFIARYGRSSQVILKGIDIDLVSDLRGPPLVEKESQKKVGMVSNESRRGVGVVSIRESNQPKSQTYTRRPLRQPHSGIQKFLEAGNKVSAGGNGIL
ncbi:hypothetical protein CsatA_009613 [Cannabis sativa]